MYGCAAEKMITGTPTPGGRRLGIESKWKRLCPGLLSVTLPGWRRGNPETGAATAEHWEVATVLGASRVLADPGSIGFGCQREGGAGTQPPIHCRFMTLRG